MKVLIYAHSFAPHIGGVETYAMLLAQGLATRSASPPTQVVLVTQTPRGAFDDAALPFTVVRRPGLARLASLMQRSSVVHLAGPVLRPLMLAVLFRKRFVVEHHGYQANCPNGLLLYEPAKSPCPGHYMQHHYLECLRCNAAEAGWFTSLRWLALTGLRRRLCARANVNLCITEHVGLRVQLPHSKVVYYGVPAPPAGAVAAITTMARGSARDISRRPLQVAYVGRLVHEKGVATLIDAVRRVQQQGCPVVLKIIGDGPQRRFLESMARERDGVSGYIQFTGSLQGSELHGALQSAAVVVIPSLNEEPAGLVVMEQMMAGRPVIVTSHGGAPEIAGDAALTFPPGDAAALANCLRRLVDEPHLLADLAAAAKKRAADLFTQERMIEDHARIFAELASST